MSQVESKRIQVNGLSFLTAVSGKGPKVLFITGTNGDLRKPNTPLNSELCEHFEVLTYDQRGMGQSEKPDVAYSMLDYAKDAIAILDAYGWQELMLAGYSFGGMVAQELAINWPERISKLALLATTAGGAGGSSYPIEEFEKLPALERARKRLAILDLSFTPQWQQLNPELAQARIEQFMQAEALYIDEPGSDIGRRRQLAARATHNTYDRLVAVRTPTLVVCATNDGQAPQQSQRAMAKQIANCAVEVVNGSHQMISENEQVYKKLIGFFSG